MNTQRTWRWIVLIVTVNFLAVLLLVGQDWVSRALDREHAMNEAFYTQPAAEAAMLKGRAWFTAAVIDTGIMRSVDTVFLPTEADSRRSLGTAGMTHWVFDWAAERIRTGWTILYGAFLRAAMLTLWWPYALFFVVPFIVDGLVQRRIVSTGFQRTSPVRHRLAILALQIVVLGYIVLLFMPIALPPLLTPALIAVTGLSFAMLSRHFAKRI